MQVFERIIDILILVGIITVYLAIRQTLTLDAAVIGLLIIIYVQQRQILKIKKSVSKKSSG